MGFPPFPVGWNTVSLRTHCSLEVSRALPLLVSPATWAGSLQDLLPAPSPVPRLLTRARGWVRWVPYPVQL